MRLEGLLETMPSQQVFEALDLVGHNSDSKFNLNRLSLVRLAYMGTLFTLEVEPSRVKGSKMSSSRGPSERGRK